MKYVIERLIVGLVICLLAAIAYGLIRAWEWASGAISVP